MHPDDLDPDGRRLPIKLDGTSNGEYAPLPMTAAQRTANHVAQGRVSDAARALGVSRRQFLKSTSGAACTLLAFNEANAALGARGGFFDIPGDAAYDTQLAEAAVGGDEFIFDIQNHCVDPAAAWKDAPDGQRWHYILTNLFQQASRCEPGSLECYSGQQLVKDVFLDSDTSVGVVSALWGAREGNPIPTEYAAEVRGITETMGGGKRALIHGGVMPNEPGALDYMEVQAREFKVSAWKLYPQWGPDGFGFFLDDPEVGIPFLEKARELDIKVVCAHRGLPLPFLAYEYSHPRDMAAAAKLYPDMTFICYHSGFEPDHKEGPYNPESEHGVDRLIRAHQDHGFERNAGNLYAELGSTWRVVMGDPDQSAHLMGKLLKYFGEDRICWGTDCLWYGSPQDQIQAFRSFQISEEFRDKFGYPEITPEIRAKVFGLNAAQPYGIDVPEMKRLAAEDDIGRLRAAYRQDPNPAFRTYGPRSRREWLRLLASQGGMPA